MSNNSPEIDFNMWLMKIFDQGKLFSSAIGGHWYVCAKLYFQLGRYTETLRNFSFLNLIVPGCNPLNFYM